uniref:Glycine N-acyltransferase-like protein n=1 Tax=Accipiter nisus TaxID=211598 RepID=A0A8B9MN12_9AVES
PPHPIQATQSQPRQCATQPIPSILPVYGAVMNINRGNPGKFEVVVDSWPDFGAVLARQSGEVAGGDMPVDDCYRNMHGAFYRDVGAYRALLETPGCLPRPSSSSSPQPRSGAGNPLQPPPPADPRRRLDPDIRVGSVSPAHVDLLNETWTYGGNARSRRYLAEVLSRFPSICLQDGTGQPICWVLTDPFGTGAHGYTLPTHRRRGHMQAAMVLAARRAQARGFPTFGHTATGNLPMQRLQEELGHQRLPGLCHFVLHNPSLGRAGP